MTRDTRSPSQSRTDPAIMSTLTASRRDNPSSHPPTLHAWLQEPSTEGPARFVRFADPVSDDIDIPAVSQYASSLSISASSPTRSRSRSRSQSTKSVTSNISMAPGALIHQSRAPTPSLRSVNTEATTTETSISTSLGCHLSGLPVLEEVDGVLQQQGPQTSSNPVYDCSFWFLNCAYMSRDRDEWEQHCLSHFQGEDPPRSVECPFCEWALTLDNGTEAWTQRMRHVAEHHSLGYSSSRTCRPQFYLFKHLWQKHLIDSSDYKELMGGNYNLSQSLDNYVETGMPVGRRDRHSRRPRTQHVGSMVRRSGPQTRS